MYCLVALLSPPYATFTYAVNPHFPSSFFVPGLRVVVPLGKGMFRAGVILGKTGELPKETEIKEIAWPLEMKAMLDANAIALAQSLAIRSGKTAGTVWGHLLPQGLRSIRARIHYFSQGNTKNMLLRDVLHLSKEDKDSIACALMDGRAVFLPPKVDAASEEHCILSTDPPWQIRPAAVIQQKILDYLLEHGAVSRRDMLSAVPGCGAAIKSLVQRGFVSLQKRESLDLSEDEGLLPPKPEPFALSDEQAAAVRECEANLDSGKSAVRLLFGVTGSGKTAVYTEIVRMCLARGRSAILLAPEVALALKLRRDMLAVFPETSVFFYHGYQSPSLREDIFRKLSERSAPTILIGTRSALYLPLPQLGCIILDEEHDASFKQDEGFIYHAKEVAWFRAEQHSALLVLGSATPDVKSFFSADNRRIQLSRLTHRVGGGRLPTVEIVDISASGGDIFLHPSCESALSETLNRGEQAVVLLNRRGYAPQMFCQDCKSVVRCPHCSISLTYHKERECLICHYCGYTVHFPCVCSQCKGSRFLPMGTGTEKLAERLSELFGKEAILRLDKDSTRRPGRMEEILGAFSRREAQILVGTQMLSKGHHFPHVSLALIADADVGLNMPDYRAAERTFQLLVQASGRAGRGSIPGRVLIQTRDTGHYCWKYVTGGDFEGFYSEEIALRKARMYPPFVCLARLLISFPLNYVNAPDLLNAASAVIRKEAMKNNVTVLGPSLAPLSVLKGRRRHHWLLKGKDWPSLRAVYFSVLPHISHKEIRFTCDLDPVNML